MNKDPKTLEALEKIKAILVEYDLFACITISSAERSHWLYHFDVSWSCLSIDPTTHEARIRAKVADFKTAEGQHYIVQQTTGAIFNTRDYAAMLFAHMDSMAKLLGKQFEIEHNPFTDVEYIEPEK